MKTLKLDLINNPPLGLEAENITYDNLVDKSLDEIAQIELYEGKKTRKLGEFFVLRGVEGAEKIILQGNLSGFHRLGWGMSEGLMLIDGVCGNYLGAHLSGGKIIVEGSACSWAGFMMSGGELLLRGDAGNFLGAGERGSGKGMSGGLIKVGGCAGSNMGAGLCGGKIIVEHNVGEFAGYQMKSGEITIKGRASRGLGAEMSDGTINVYGGVDNMLSSFRKKDDIYVGDYTVKGKGRIRLR